MQTFIIKNHDNLTNNYSIGINICVINYYIHKFYKEDNNNPIIYNKYISRSMANINSLNVYNNTDFRYYNLLIYLFYTYNELRTDKYKEIIKWFYNKYPKETNNNNKKFEYFYNKTINLKMLY